MRIYSIGCRVCLLSACISWSPVHAALGINPQQMVFGRQPYSALPLSSNKLLAAAHTGSQVPSRLSPVVPECTSPLSKWLLHSSG
jgi:hypothetical protein